LRISGAQVGNYAVVYLKKYVSSISLLFFNSYEEIMKSARRGKVKVFVTDDTPIDHHLIKYGIHDEFDRAEPTYEELIYSAVNEGNTGLLKLINMGLELISKREMGVIHNKWFGKLMKLFKARKYPLWISLSGFSAVVSVILCNQVYVDLCQKRYRRIEKNDRTGKSLRKIKMEKKEHELTLSGLPKQNRKLQRVIDMFSKLSEDEDTMISLQIYSLQRKKMYQNVLKEDMTIQEVVEVLCTIKQN